jgi:hypothetical protein
MDAAAQQVGGSRVDEAVSLDSRATHEAVGSHADGEVRLATFLPSGMAVMARRFIDYLELARGEGALKRGAEFGCDGHSCTCLHPSARIHCLL